MNNINTIDNYNLSNKQSFIMNITCLTSIVLIFLGVSYSNYFLVLCFIFNSIICLFLNTKYCFCLLMFLMPFGLVYKINGVNTSFFTILELLVELIVIYRMRIFKKSNVIAIIFPLIYFSIIMGTYYFSIFKILATLLLIYLFIANYKIYDLKTYIMYFAVSLILSSIIGLFKENINGLLSYYTDLNYEWINGVYKIRFSGLFNDPNYYTIAIITALLVLIFVKKTMNMSTLIYFLLYIALSIFGFLTYSKSFLIMYILILFTTFYFNILDKRFNFLAIEIVFIIMIIFLIVYGRIPIINDFLYRFTNSQGLTTGRDLIWKRYIEKINSNFKNILFGCGLDAEYVGGKATHNMYLELIYYSGFVGMTIYLASIFFIIFSNTNRRKIKLLNIIPMIMIFSMYFFLSAFLNYAFPFYMIFLWCLLNVKYKR